MSVKIKDSQRKEVLFETLSIGDYFYFDGNYYIKSETDQDEDQISVNVKEGYLRYFNGSSYVTPVDVEITVSTPS